MKTEITKQRLIELGNSLMGIIRELQESVDVPESNPPKKRSRKAEKRAYYANLIDSKINQKSM